MFGPDLDIYSRHYQRWGFFRFIWLPYQKSLRHRSFLSHGPIIGTTLRVIYLSTLVGLLAIVIFFIAEKLWRVELGWQTLGQTAVKAFLQYSTELLALFLGLELGAMSHSLSDWSGSAYKRFQKQGVRGLLPHGKIKKSKVKSRSNHRAKGAKVKPLSRGSQKRQGKETDNH
ncbi:hypothetical protein NUACC21_24290 [Scytonema sp. NUACC21]